MVWLSPARSQTGEGSDSIHGTCANACERGRKLLHSQQIIVPLGVWSQWLFGDARVVQA